MKKKLLILVILFILSACSNSTSDAVEADFEKMDYNFIAPSELDESEIIQPGSVVTLEGEITNKKENATNITAAKMPEHEGVLYEVVVFEQSNLFMVTTGEAGEYTILVNETDDFNQWNEGDFITVTGTFEGPNSQTREPVIKADEIAGMEELPDN